MRTFSIVPLLFIIASASFAAAPDDITGALKKDLVHPYVYFTASEKAALLERTRTDPVCGDHLRKLIAEANRLVYTPVEEPPARVRNARYDGAYAYENWLLRIVGYSYDLALAYQMTGDGRYAVKSFEFADAVCDQPTWVHGAHEFPEIYDRVWPWGAKDDQVVFNYAQWSDHFVIRLAAVYDWLYPALAKRDRDRIRGALLEKAILRVRGNYDYHWWAAAYRCNWCAVCNGSLGIAAAALLTEDPQLVDVVAESYTRIGKTLDEVKDGGWQEGMSYLGYMLGEAFRFGDVLRRISGGKLDLYRHPRIPDAVATLLYCRFPPDKGVHFGDSGGGAAGDYTLLNRIAGATGDPSAFWLRDTTTSGVPGGLLEYIEPHAEGKAALPAVVSRQFPSVGWAVMRSDFTDPEKVGIACKSGPANDPHHGHLDQGHVSLYWRGIEFLTDHGSAGYDRKYFDRERWDYPLAATRGHNTVMVDGGEQICGKLKDAPWTDAGGRIALFRPGTDRDYTILDPTGAYPSSGKLKSWRRHVVLEKPRLAVILDEVACAPGSEVEARFHSAVAQSVKGSWVMLGSGKDTMALVPAALGGCALRAGSHAILMAQKNASYRTVPYVGAVAKASDGTAILAAVALPVESVADAEKTANSVKLARDSAGNVTLSFTAEGKDRLFRFRKGVEGLALE